MKDTVMKIHVDVYGLERMEDGEFSNPKKMYQTTVVGDANIFRLVSEFFAYAASEYEKYGDDFEHEHFQDWCKRKGIKWSGGDLIAQRDHRGDA